MSFYEKQGRYILMALNIIFMVGGIICLAVGLWLAIEVSGLIGGCLIVAGILSCALHALGYEGAHKNDTTKLKCYAWILTFITVLTIISAIVNISMADAHNTREDPNAAQYVRQVNILSFINVAIQAFCIVLAFGLASAITKKSNLPPVYANM